MENSLIVGHRPSGGRDHSVDYRSFVEWSPERVEAFDACEEKRSGFGDKKERLLKMRALEGIWVTCCICLFSLKV